MNKALIFSLVFCVALLGSQVSAQPADELTIDLIELRLKTLRDAGTSDQDETLLTYEAARGFLSQVGSRNRDTATYTEALTTAPIREVEIQARVDELDDEADPLEELEGLSNDEIQARLPLARTELSDANASLITLDRMWAARETNATAIRTRLAEIALRIDELPDETISVNPDTPPSLPEARRWRDASEFVALTADRRAQTARLSSQPARYSTMAAARVELSLTIARLSAIVRELESRNRDDLLAVADPQSLGIDPEDAVYPVAARLISADAELRHQHVEVNDRLAEVGLQVEVVSNRTRELTERFATARRVVDFAADSDELGRVLLAYWDEIDSYTVKVPINRLPREVSGAVILILPRDFGHQV